MGLEFITQPQVFTQRLTALGGIEGYVPPFVSSFFTWTSTSPVTATTFPLPGSIGLLDIPGSYIVSVGGVLQSPTNYVINVPNRTLTFDFTVNANTDVVITQIGTVGLSSNIAFLSSQQFIATNLSATTGSFNSLLVSNLTALSSVLQVTDIQLFELSGFNIQGNLNVSNNLSALNYIITDNGSFIGATSATTMNIGFLSARGIDLIHSPANDGVDPILNIGETDTAGFSGFRVRYEEPTNRLIGSSRTGTTVLTSFMIDTTTGQVGVSGLPAPGQALTVTGNISALGNISSSGITVLGNLSATGSIVGSNTDTYYVLTATRTITTNPSATYFDPSIAIPLLANRQYTLQYDLYHAKDATASSILFALSTTNSSLTAAANFTHLASIGTTAQPVMAGVVGRVGPIITLPSLATLTANVSSFTQINATLELGASPATLLLAVSSAGGNLNALRGSKRVLTLLN